MDLPEGFDNRLPEGIMSGKSVEEKRFSANSSLSSGMQNRQHCE